MRRRLVLRFALRGMVWGLVWWLALFMLMMCTFPYNLICLPYSLYIAALGYLTGTVLGTLTVLLPDPRRWLGRYQLLLTLVALPIVIAGMSVLYVLYERTYAVRQTEIDTTFLYVAALALVPVAFACLNVSTSYVSKWLPAEMAHAEPPAASDAQASAPQ